MRKRKKREKRMISPVSGCGTQPALCKTTTSFLEEWSSDPRARWLELSRRAEGRFLRKTFDRIGGYAISKKSFRPDFFSVAPIYSEMISEARFDALKKAIQDQTHQSVVSSETSVGQLRTEA